MARVMVVRVSHGVRVRPRRSTRAYLQLRSASSRLAKTGNPRLRRVRSSSLRTSDCVETTPRRPPCWRNPRAALWRTPSRSELALMPSPRSTTMLRSPAATAVRRSRASSRADALLTVTKATGTARIPRMAERPPVRSPPAAEGLLELELRHLGATADVLLLRLFVELVARPPVQALPAPESSTPSRGDVLA